MLTLKNKSENLKILQKTLKKSFVLPQYSFSVNDFLKDPLIKEEIAQFCHDEKDYIVRSASVREDNYQFSAAGKYLSVLNVTGYADIIHSVEKVIDSFEKERRDENLIFIQPMLETIYISGVAFTLDPNNGGNYYVINYDKSGLTNIITSGQSRGMETYYLYKEMDPLNKEMAAIVDAIKEIERLYGDQPLDIEFACTKAEEICIFQVRPLHINAELSTYEVQNQTLKDAYDFIMHGMGKNPFVLGEYTIYGIMPDWNPAEIIGVKPRPLAKSVYRYLVTDEVWSLQRNYYGYKNMKNNPLMVEIAGVPYIDTRISFNSFIPEGLDDELANRLVSYYLNNLYEHPEKHDKIEFSIIYASNTFDLKKRLQTLLEHGFSENDLCKLESKLVVLTNTIINFQDGLWKKDVEKIRILQKRYNLIMNSSLNLISKIYWLLVDCRRYGTVAFAGLARSGFIAVQLLKSLVDTNIFTVEEYNNFMKNLNTVSKQLFKDRLNFSKDSFMEKYGHLRPGTYDITIQRYDHNPELYYDQDEIFEEEKQSEIEMGFSLSISKFKLIEEKLHERGFTCSVLEFFEFVQQAIEWREYSKFVFSKSLSDAYELIYKMGDKYGFTREDISFLNVRVILDMYVSSNNYRNIIEESIAEGKRNYNTFLTINMPPLIFTPQDVYEFVVTEDEANYITLNCIEGIITECISDQLHGKILIIESADPGYDWVFTHNIGGLITKYGGVNSHMAIRAGELGLPAAIGVGDRKYNIIKNSRYVKLDCANRKIEILY